MTHSSISVATSPTTVSVLESTGDVLGFLTLAADSILHDGEASDEPIKTVPAIKLCRIGVATSYQNLGFGKSLVDYAIGAVRSLQDEGIIAARFLTLDAYPNRVKWYERLGFVCNEHRIYARRQHPSMRFLV